MAIFKCKICGGALELDGQQTIVSCAYCGTKQTLPRLDDERRANLYDRANHFRRNNDFDKAMGMYEHILSEDTTDAEAYWSIILCRYGIEYVEDPATHRRVPTVNRAQYTSIFDDEDYKSAIANADGYQREIYEAEAAAINEIQKGILAISQKEEPFDIFICYKETDASGRRTQDSALATELYHELVREGFKAFFSRITLEDKLGVAYEPYIFAALNSAKVMVVLGTRPEHFNAVWVKNEWSRYLALIKNGARKTLVPAYRDMDPYDLPEEFSHLQALDMSRLGFMTDLVHAIKKMVGKKEAPEAPKAPEPVSTAPTLSVTPLFKRMYMALEDGEFERADSFCEQILNLEPENARGYLGKLLCECRVSSEAALRDYKFPFDGSCNYQKVLRFGDDELKQTLAEYLEHIYTRNRLAQQEEAYTRAKNRMEGAGAEHTFREAALLFEALGDYKDAAALATQCIAAAEEAKRAEEQARLEAIYMSGVQQLKNARAHQSIRGLRVGIQKLTQIPDYKDAKEQIAQAELIKQKFEQALQKKAKQIRRIALASVISLAAVALVIILTINVFIPQSKYNRALDLMKDGNYTEAIDAFKELDDYLDSKKKIKECEAKIEEERIAILDAQYDNAITLMKDGKYDEAIAAFESLNGYRDSDTKITETYELKYQIALTCMNAKKYEESIKIFESLGNYKDSSIKIEECKAGIKERSYQQALALMEDGEYVKAIEIFETLGTYKYTTSKIKECQDALKEIEYQKALALMEQEKYDEAITVFIPIMQYRDSQAKLVQCDRLKNYKTRYENATQLLTKGKTDAALAEFYELGSYKDSKEKADSLLAAKYANAISLMEQGKYSEAQTEFNVLATSYSYLDSADKAEKCRTAILDAQYNEACALMAEGKYSEAYDLFVSLGFYSDSEIKAEECRTAMLDATYEEALALMDAKEYEKAYALFMSLDGHSDSVLMAAQCRTEMLNIKYNKALALMEAGEYAEAYTMFISLGTHRDSREKAEECRIAQLDIRYNEAMALLAEEKYIEAYEMLLALNGHRDSAEKAASFYDKYFRQKLKNVKAGDTVFLGTYEQDGNDSNGKEKIEWIVLDVTDGKVLVISKQVLDHQKYHNAYQGATWENSTLRAWLNNEFLNAAFTTTEQALISAATVSADPNSRYPNTSQGNATTDKIFLLSEKQANQYFAFDTNRRCYPTAFAAKNSDTASAANWWLRTSGAVITSISTNTAYVKSDGSINNGGATAITELGVRPAFQIELAT